MIDANLKNSQHGDGMDVDGENVVPEAGTFVKALQSKNGSADAGNPRHPWGRGKEWSKWKDQPKKSSGIKGGKNKPKGYGWNSRKNSGAKGSKASKEGKRGAGKGGTDGGRVKGR